MLTATQPSSLIVSNASLRTLSAAADRTEEEAANTLLLQLAAELRQANDLLEALPPALRLGSPDSYCRHVAYADPDGRFTIVYLVWRPGQFSPVHGHRTWCAYRMLQGELSETLYRWNAQAREISVTGRITRKPGDIFTAAPGLRQTHRLGNAGTATAISMHIYGVAEENISTGVNLLPPSTLRSL
jgi:predicted metal-dependent enzyme (double-stranded beta helix superfamily)